MPTWIFAYPQRLPPWEASEIRSIKRNLDSLRDVPHGVSPWYTRGVLGFSQMYLSPPAAIYYFGILSFALPLRRLPGRLIFTILNWNYRVQCCAGRLLSWGSGSLCVKNPFVCRYVERMMSLLRRRFFGALADGVLERSIFFLCGIHFFLSIHVVGDLLRPIETPASSCKLYPGSGSCPSNSVDSGLIGVRGRPWCDVTGLCAGKRRCQNSTRRSSKYRDQSSLASVSVQKSLIYQFYCHYERQDQRKVWRHA